MDTKPRPIRVTVKGKCLRFKSVQAAAKHFKLPYVLVYGRLRIGWKPNKALTTPMKVTKTRAYKQHPQVAAHYNRLLNETPAPSKTLN